MKASNESLWDAADRLGEMSFITQPKPIPRPKVIETPTARLSKNVWPPEVWAEIQAIYAEADDA